MVHKRVRVLSDQIVSTSAKQPQLLRSQPGEVGAKLMPLKVGRKFETNPTSPIKKVSAAETLKDVKSQAPKISYQEMIEQAITTLCERGGSTSVALWKVIHEKYPEADQR